MNTERIVIKARAHVSDNPQAESSARLCLADEEGGMTKGEIIEALELAEEALDRAGSKAYADMRPGVVDILGVFQQFFKDLLNKERGLTPLP